MVLNGVIRTDYDNYNSSITWEENKPGWHTHSIILVGNIWYVRCIEMINWLYDNIDKCERHARWYRVYRVSDGEFNVKFRYERDYIFFALRWL